eukprot:TRINITY_DN4988_c0_g1_i1.p2 TRINITY_DN4988_c0_g1~~TRINITY_DN4988_c0_g1_i1.p2  ORF type:complete len:210 (-),score=69.60 TRINITY_DN4988_c0_g1_i1:35-664(-)
MHRAKTHEPRPVYPGTGTDIPEEDGSTKPDFQVYTKNGKLIPLSPTKEIYKNRSPIEEEDAAVKGVKKMPGRRNSITKKAFKSNDSFTHLVPPHHSHSEKKEGKKLSDELTVDLESTPRDVVEVEDLKKPKKTFKNILMMDEKKKSKMKMIPAPEVLEIGEKKNRPKSAYDVRNSEVNLDQETVDKILRPRSSIDLTQKDIEFNASRKF